MIIMKETREGFERLTGNPTLTSLDGERRAPLRVILHPSWTDAERAEFGVFEVQPAAIPEGKRVVGEPRYEKRRDAVAQVVDLEDIPPTRDPLTGPMGKGVLAQMHRFVSAGDGHPAHKHDDTYQYTAIVRGGVRCDIDGQRGQDFYAPAIVEIGAGIMHQMTAIEDDTVFFCIFDKAAQ